MMPRCYALPLGLFLLSIVGQTEAAQLENPYGTIVSRNAFSLHPPQVEPVAAAPEPTTTIHLTGITAFADDQKAWFVIGPAHGAGSVKFGSLGEGESSQGIEVIKITRETGEVMLREGGNTKTISLQQTKF